MDQVVLAITNTAHQSRPQSRSDYFPPLKLKIEIILGPDSDRLPLPSVRSLLYWRLSSVVSSPCLLSLFSPRATWTTCSPWPLITQYFATTRELNTVTRDLLSMNHEPSQVVKREQGYPSLSRMQNFRSWSNPLSKPKPGLHLYAYAASLSTHYTEIIASINQGQKLY